MTVLKIQRRLRKKVRIRARVTGSESRPRLSVYRSLTAISAQLIDDAAGKTLCGATSREAKVKMNMEGAKKVGELLAKKAKEAGVTTAVFDRNGFAYHGRIKALADAAREGGLKF